MVSSTKFRADRTFALNRLFRLGEPQSCCFSAPDCFYMFHRRAETESRHIAIHRFELVWVDSIGFVPDAHASIRTDGLIESLPGCEMRVRGLTGEALQIFEGAPVLDQNRSAEVPEELRVQKSFFGMCIYSSQHRPHCTCDRDPFVEPPPLVDAHTDQKDDEGLIGFGCITTIKYFSHDLTPHDFVPINFYFIA